MQTWVPNFNPVKPRVMKIPTWITLRRVPDEFQCVAKQIAEGIGEVLGGDKQNSTLHDQRFCVALPAGNGWVTSVEVINDTTGEQSSIIIDYANLPIRCRFCFDTAHKAKDCPSLASQHNRDTTSPPSASLPNAAVTRPIPETHHAPSGNHSGPPPVLKISSIFPSPIPHHSSSNVNFLRSLFSPYPQPPFASQSTLLSAGLSRLGLSCSEFPHVSVQIRSEVV